MSFKYGNVYHFELIEDRRQLTLEDQFEDKKADDESELEEVVFGQNFGGGYCPIGWT